MSLTLKDLQVEQPCEHGVYDRRHYIERDPAGDSYLVLPLGDTP